MDEARSGYLKLLHLDPKNPLAISRIGLIWAEQGNPVAAIPYLSEAAVLPDGGGNATVRVSLARAYCAVGNVVAARKEALSVMKTSRNPDAAMITLAESIRSQIGMSECEHVIKSTEWRSNGSALVALALLSERAGARAEARSLLDAAMRHAGNSAEVYRACGDLHVLHGQDEEAKRSYERAFELGKRRSPERLKYAEFLLAHEGDGSAEAALERMVSETPDYLPYWRLLARIAIGQSRHDDALSHLENVLSRDANDIEARVLQAEAWHSKGMREDALKSLQQLAEHVKGKPFARYTLALARLRSGFLEGATNALREAIASEPDLIDARLLLAQIRLSSGDAAGAAADLAGIAARHPSDRGIGIHQARAMAAAGQFQDARNLLAKHIESAPGNESLRLALGEVCLQQGESEAAKEAFAHVLEIDPQSFGARVRLCEWELCAGNLAAASDHLRQLAPSGASRPEVQLLRARIMVADRTWGEAESILTGIVEKWPSDRPAGNLLIKIYLGSGRIDQALECLNGRLEKQPDDVESLLLASVVHQERGHFESGKALLDRLIKVDPNHVAALNNLAYLLSEQSGDHRHALELAERARELDRGNASVADTLGWIHYRLTNLRAALPLLRESARKLDTDPTVRFHLGMVEYALGDEMAAAAALEAASRSEKDFEWKPEARRALEVLRGSRGSRGRDAIDELRAQIESQPRNATLWRRIGDARSQLGEMESAAKAYDRALAINPDLHELHAAVARIHLEALSDPGKGLAHATEARRLRPDDPGYKALLGRAALSAGRHEWAFGLLKESARLFPDDWRSQRDLSLAAHGIGLIEEARVAMRTAANSSPDSYAAMAEEARRFLMLTQIDWHGPVDPATLSDIREVIKTSPDDLPTLMARASILHLENDRGASMALCERIVRQFPEFFPAKSLLATINYGDPATWDDARKLALAVRERHPDDPDACTILARLAVDGGNWQYAIDLFEEIGRKAALTPDDHFRMGIAFHRVRRTDEATRSLRRAIESGLEVDKVREAKSILTQITSSREMIKK